MKKVILPIAFFAALSAGAQKVFDVPYKQTFDTEGTLNDFINIDANNDGNGWGYNPMMHCAKCNWSDVGPVDDYLMLPVHLDARANYELTFNCSGGYFDDRFDLWMGTEPTPEGMTVQLMKPMEVKNINTTYVHRVNITVETGGTYYIAWHGCSGEGQGTIFLDNIEITGTASVMPAASELVSVTPGEKGERVCDLEFDLPTKTLDGDELQEVPAVRIYRSDVLVATLKKDAEGNALKPGARCTYHDKELGNRLYTYKVVALTASGEEGAPAVAEVYVGLDRPGRVLNLRCREDIEHPGRVVLTWDAPEKGVHGGYLDPKGVSYCVAKSYDDEPTVFETRYEEQVDISHGQTMAVYSVYAQNAVGDNRQDWQTISTHVGPAVKAPWSESWPGVTCKNGPWLTHVTAETEVGEASWYVSSPVGGMDAQDADGGYTYFFTSGLGKSSRYTSPKIDISSLNSPRLSFWLYEWGNADVVEVGVMADMKEWETLKSITLDGTKGWHRYSVDLSQYLGAQFVQVGFNGISYEETRHITAIDNVSIRDEAEYDVAVQSYDFPARVDMGRDNGFTLTLRNRGAEDLAEGSYTVNLYRIDPAESERQLVCSVEGAALASDMTDEVTLKDNPGIFTSESVKYSAEVVLDGDATPADNVVEAQDVVVFRPAYPVPQQLAATCSADGVEMVWVAPDVTEGSALPVTESFESYPIFSVTDCGDWSLYDGDQERTVVMALSTGDDILLLDYENAGQPMAWQVFSAIDAGIPYTSWDAHSGELMMVSMSNTMNADGTYHDNDDWLISPELSGRAQSISFFAKCGMGSAYQPERLEVLCSKTNREVEAFETVETFDLYNVSGWEECISTLPAGAKYFALRCVSSHKFALLLDDVTYHPAGRADLTLLGYNVYRDRVRLNAELLPTPTFADATAEEGIVYEYCVTAVYAEGESVPSEPLNIVYEADGIAMIGVDRAASAVYDASGRRAAKTAKGVVIAGGKCLKW